MANAHTKYGVQPRPWTTAEDAKLTDLYHAGVSQAEIGRQLRRTAKSINGRIERLKPSDQPARRGWTAEQDAELLALRDEGLTHREIGLRCTPTRTYGAVRDELAKLRKLAEAPAATIQAPQEPPDEPPVLPPSKPKRLLPWSREALAKAEERMDFYRIWERRNQRLLDRAR